MLVLAPISIIAERSLWREVFTSGGHLFLLKLGGALGLDVLALILTTLLACLLQMTDFGYYVYAVLLLTDRRILLSIFQGTCTTHQRLIQFLTACI